MHFPVAYEVKNHGQQYEANHLGQIPVAHGSVQQTPPFLVYENKHIQCEVCEHGNCAYLGEAVQNTVMRLPVGLADLV